MTSTIRTLIRSRLIDVTKHLGDRPAQAIAGLGLAAAMLLAPCTAGAFDVTTHHYDILRTGLNNQETTLTPATVASPAFTKLNTVTFNGHVDAQPLVISAATWAGWGFGSTYSHDVAFVATSNNDLIAIDSVTGQILRTRNFGTPVGIGNLPGGCNNNAPTVGITSTPVIDPVSHAMYLISYTVEGSQLVYRLYKVNPADLSDLTPSVVVSATHVLSDGTLTAFQAAYQRQRSALLLSNGNVYAGFAAFCDQATNYSRGWVLGWNAATLAPLPNAALMEQQSASQVGSGLSLGFTTVDYLSSIWMSGWGLAAAPNSGNIYLQTGNSNGTLPNNLPDSVVKLSPNLANVIDSFTPSNFSDLDKRDLDRGSGGVMVVPDQPGGLSFAVAGGKDGRLMLLNRNGLGGFVPNGPDVPKVTQLEGCWCGPDYFVGADGRGRIVSTHGTTARTWLLPTTLSGNLSAEATGVSLPSDGSIDPGFMSSVSSNGTAANSAVIWSVSRQLAGRVYLQALDATPSTVSGSVTDSDGNVWSLGATVPNTGGNHLILLNGVNTGGWAVKLVIGPDFHAYVLAAAGQWYAAIATQPVTYTAVAPPKARPASPAGALVAGGTEGGITDRQGNVWSFGPQAAGRAYGEYVVVLNGVPTSGVASFALIGADGAAWLYVADVAAWYTGDGTTWTRQTGTPSVLPNSPAGASITASGGGTLVDQDGAIWTFGTGIRYPGEHDILRNGLATGGWATSLSITATRQVAAFAAGSWWSYAGGTYWTARPAPYLGAVVAGTYATPAAPGELRQLQLLDAGGWLPEATNPTNANVVPVVANGKVYVATPNALTIWGLR